MQEPVPVAEKLIICVFRLPIKAKRLPDGSIQLTKNDAALYRTITGLEKALQDRVQIVHIGLLWGVDVSEDEEEELEERPRSALVSDGHGGLAECAAQCVCALLGS